MRKMVQFGCSLCIIFASLLHACLALYVEQVNEMKLVCVCGARKSCFEASSFPAPTSIFGARLDRSKAAGTYQISHTGQAPARAVSMMAFACMANFASKDAKFPATFVLCACFQRRCEDNVVIENFKDSVTNNHSNTNIKIVNLTLSESL
jgi:hypothetical protein